MNGYRRSNLHTVKMAVWLVMAMVLLMVLAACSSGGGSQTTYRLDVFLNDEDAGSVHRDPDKDRYLPNEIVTLTAVPEDDWDFSYWDGDASGDDPEIEITMTSNKTVTAVFSSPTATEFAVQFGVIGSHGNLAGEADGQPIASGDMVAQGAEVTFTATPDAGYQVKGWVVNGTPLEVTDTTYTRDSLAENLNVQVEFQSVGIEFAGGTGEEGDPYLIATPAQLNNVRNHLDKHFRVIADLDLSGYANDDGWNPIGEAAHSWHGISYSPFAGTFDGDGYTISNLYMNREYNGTGLFGAVDNAVITNVVLQDAEVFGRMMTGALIGECTDSQVSGCSSIGDTIVEGGTDTGGLIGLMRGGTLSNVSAAGQVKGSYHAGGVVGRNLAGTITDSAAAVTVRLPDNSSRAGGFVGTNDDGTIRNSYAEGFVDLRYVWEMHTTGGSGGFVGNNIGSDSLIENCYALGDVQGNLINSRLLGGFVGQMSAGVIRQCYAAGAVTAWDYAGGFVARITGGTIEQSFATGSVTARDGAGGFAGHSDAGVIQDCYALGDASASRQWAGNFVGRVRGDIYRCYSIGKVLESGMSRGGFWGGWQHGASLVSTYFDRDTTAVPSDQNFRARTTVQLQEGTPGAFILSGGGVDASETSTNLMYDGWDPAVWDFGTDNEYPQLQWQE